MWLIPHALAKSSLGAVRMATVMVALSSLFAFAQNADSTLMLFENPAPVEPVANSSATAATDSVASVSSDSIPAAPFVPVAEPVVLTADSSVKNPADSSAVESLQEVSTQVGALQIGAPQSSALKTVLYLGGGERSPWFHLGVLYAVEEYGIPVDSVVGTSWGAWVGSLWAKGVPLDEIQKIMRDSVIAPYVGHDLSDPKNRLGVTNRDVFELPISEKGMPSLRQRFTMTIDESGLASRNKKALYRDSMDVVRAMAKLRFQETLYRQNLAYRIPFSVQGCGGKDMGKKPADVIASLPLWTNERDASSDNASSGNVSSDTFVNGELCPHYALPVEDNVTEFPIVVVADPLRSSFEGDARSNLLKEKAGENLNNLPGAIIRAHSVLDTSYTNMIQLGFSTFERNLKEFVPLGSRRVSYKETLTNKDVRKAWFRFNPAFDSLSSETHRAVNMYWNESDTGLVALDNFASKLLKNPAYDSLRFDMQPTGDVMVSASVHPTFDAAVGGFGSNTLGANAYFEGSVNYVNQMEIELVLAGFWGTSSYGVLPRLNVAKLWSRHWGLQFAYDYLMLRPLKNFNNDIPAEFRVNSEERSNFTMSVVYELDDRQKVSADFLFGHSEFELNPLYYGHDKIKTNPVAPTLHYEYLKGDKDSWFAQNGLSINAYAGLESIGFDYGITDLIPIYWKLYGDVRYSVSPKSFATFTVGGAAGIERYHDEGHGYVSPASFGFRPLDIAYRFQVHPTPWSTEWYNGELASHEYGLIRGSASLHGKNLGVWLFAAYYHDFEDSPFAQLSKNKFIVEPAIRFVYKSIDVYVGMNRIVDADTFGDIADFSNYTYFIRFGNYSF